MYSLGVPQIILALYLIVIIIGAPVARYLMIDGGAKGFCPWREYWGTWSADLVGKIVLVAILFWGGFWS
jgi:hypothetical protein